MANDIDFPSLIAELPDWNEGRGIEPETWIECMGNYELAIGYSLIFWPRFIVIDDYVLRAGSTVEALRNFEEATGGDRRATEAVMNHIHIADIHTSGAEPSEAQVRYLGRLMKETLTAKLKAEFPDRSFVVRFTDEPGLDITDYELTFWQQV